MVEDGVRDLLVLHFGLEAPRDHTRVEIAPERYTFIQLVLLVHFLGPLGDELPDPFLGGLQAILLAFDPVEQPDDVLGQRFELFLRVYLLAHART